MIGNGLESVTVTSQSDMLMKAAGNNEWLRLTEHGYSSSANLQLCTLLN